MMKISWENAKEMNTYEIENNNPFVAPKYSQILIFKPFNGWHFDILHGIKLIPNNLWFTI